MSSVYPAYAFHADLADLPEGHQRAMQWLFKGNRDLNNANTINVGNYNALSARVATLEKSGTSGTAKAAPGDPPLPSNVEIGITPASIAGRGGTSPTGATSPNTSAVGNTGASYAQGAYATGVNQNTPTMTEYSIQDYDYQAIVPFNSPDPVTVTLNSAVKTNFQCLINNAGAGTITLAPTTGLVNGQASVTLQSGANATVGFDGQNWAAASFTGQLPTTLTPVAGEYVTGYDASDGEFSVNAVPGISGTVALAKLTTGGTNGSLTITNGLVTAIVAPT